MAERIGLTGLYVLALSALLFPAPANLGLLAMVLATIARGRDFLQWLRQAPAAWLAFGFTAYVLLRGAAEIAVGDLAPAAAWKPITGWAMLGMAPFVAFWCGGREDRCRLLFLLALIGLLIEALRHMDADAINKILHLQREDFGLRLLGAPLYASIAMLGLLVFLPRIRAWLHRQLPGRWVAAGYISLVLVFGYLLLIFLLAQSRSSWLAAVIAFPVVGVGLLLTPRRQRFRHRLRAFAVVIVVLGVVGGILASWVGDTLVDRVSAESETWSAFVEGRWKDVPYGSIGRRFHMTVAGLRWYAEAPVFGIGPGSVEPRLRGMDHLSIHEDLHNTYLDLGVELGAVGLLLLMGFVAWAYLALVDRYRKGDVGRGLFWFLTGALLIYFLVAAMNMRLVNFDGQFSWLLLTGVLLAFAWEPQGKGYCAGAKCAGGRSGSSG